MSSSLASVGSCATDHMVTFSFGDPEPVLNRREILDMVECYHNGRWYAPPIPLDGLARAFRVSPHHSSAIIVKRNQIVAAFEPSAMLGRRDFEAMVQDHLVFADGYLERRDNMFGDPLRLVRSPAKYTRRGVADGQYYFVPSLRDETAFRPGTICQISAPDINQEIYGVPEYLSALQSALLNEAATLFRRKYYLNGSHAGYILHATGEINERDVDALREALKSSKGPGNFRNLFIHSPGGKEGTIKILPIAEVAAKDEFLGIKNTTRDDILAAHRVPPQLLGVVPANAGGFGDVSKANDAFYELEILPLQAKFLEINDWMGMEVVRFRERARAA
jgi:PBSX family phage portal protein